MCVCVSVCLSVCLEWLTEGLGMNLGVKQVMSQGQRQRYFHIWNQGQNIPPAEPITTLNSTKCENKHTQ